MNNIFTNKKIYQMLGSQGPANAIKKQQEKNKKQKENPTTLQDVYGKSYGKKGPAKTRAEMRADKTKAKAKNAKIAADKANDGSSNASLDKMNKTKAKAERLAKRQKRQEGRAERKKIRKESKKGEMEDMGGYSKLKMTPSQKKEKIKATRKKQNSKDPVVKKQKPENKTRSGVYGM